MDIPNQKLQSLTESIAALRATINDIRKLEQKIIDYKANVQTFKAEFSKTLTAIENGTTDIKEAKNQLTEFFNSVTKILSNTE